MVATILSTLLAVLPASRARTSAPATARASIPASKPPNSAWLQSSLTSSRNWKSAGSTVAKSAGRPALMESCSKVVALKTAAIAQRFLMGDLEGSGFEVFTYSNMYVCKWTVRRSGQRLAQLATGQPQHSFE